MTGGEDVKWSKLSRHTTKPKEPVMSPTDSQPTAAPRGITADPGVQVEQEPGRWVHAFVRGMDDCCDAWLVGGVSPLTRKVQCGHVEEAPVHLRVAQLPATAAPDVQPEQKQLKVDKAIAELRRFEAIDREAVARGESPNWWERGSGPTPESQPVDPTGAVLESAIAWLKRRRDEHQRDTEAWNVLDAAVDDMRDHYYTGTPLDKPVLMGPWAEVER